jgi:hypothetical protein
MSDDLQPNETVGFTNDGKVFFSAVVRDPDGRPMNIMFNWEPNRARQIADWLLVAAREVNPPSLIVGAYG